MVVCEAQELSKKSIVFQSLCNLGPFLNTVAQKHTRTHPSMHAQTHTNTHIHMYSVSLLNTLHKNIVTVVDNYKSVNVIAYGYHGYVYHFNVKTSLTCVTELLKCS